MNNNVYEIRVLGDSRKKFPATPRLEDDDSVPSSAAHQL